VHRSSTAIATRQSNPTRHPPTRKPAGLAAKRAFDIIVGALLCLLVLPVVALLAVVLAFQQRSFDVFFIHSRIGYGGALVTIPKLRTLRRDTHPYADKTVVELVPVSAFARLLRRTHLDELPQLFLVPLGRLTLVGPRPRMIDEAVDDGDEAFCDLRTSVPQGCTGLWQVGAHTSGRVSDTPAYDCFYVARRTLRMDLWVMWRTVAQLAGAQPVSLDRVPRWTMRRADSGDDIVIDLTDDNDDVLGWDRDALARAADL
jgi:lipopolysaccharide/colanic/teichoic acid biosynthesis glycosyltransferase